MVEDESYGKDPMDFGGKYYHCMHNYHEFLRTPLLVLLL